MARINQTSLTPKIQEIVTSRINNNRLAARMEEEAAAGQSDTYLPADTVRNRESITGRIRNAAVSNVNTAASPLTQIAENRSQNLVRQDYLLENEHKEED